MYMYVPGLVNVYITNWKITMLSMGKSTISTGSFSSSHLSSLQRALCFDRLARRCGKKLDPKCMIVQFDGMFQPPETY